VLRMVTKPANGLINLFVVNGTEDYFYKRKVNLELTTMAPIGYMMVYIKLTLSIVLVGYYSIIYLKGILL